MSAFGPLLQSGVVKALGPVEGIINKFFAGGLGSAAIVAGFAAAGAAAVKMASDYEDALAKIEGLVGLTHEQTVQLGDDMLNLAKVVPVAPEELAKAMFFIESAGLRGQDAMDALTASAKASAAGLGDIMTVADAVTSAVNSYAQSGLTAAHATDIMVAAVREGKLPPQDLAAALGQVLPVASQMGVEFDEVAAAIASATRQGLSAARAATGVRFLLTAFIKPSGDAVEALASVGMGIGQLQNELKSEGLLATLQDLADKFDLSTAAGKQMFAQVVGGARGLSVAAILVGENGAAIQKVFDNIKNSAGSTQRAFDVAMGTLSNQFKLIASSAKAFAIQFGTVLLPVLTAVAKVLGAVLAPALRVVANDAKLLLSIFGAYMATKLLPTIAAGVQLLATAMKTLGATTAALRLTQFSAWLESLSVSLPEVALAVGAVFLGWEMFKSAMNGTKNLVQFHAQGFHDLGLTLDEAQAKLAKLNALEESAPRAFGLTSAQREGLELYIARLKDGTIHQEELNAALEETVKQGGSVAITLDQLLGGAISRVSDTLAMAGVDINEWSAGLAKALHGGEAAFNKFSQETLQNVSDGLAQFQQQTSSAINFTTDAMQTLASQSDLTGQKILDAFKKSQGQTEAFGKNLLEIAHHGGKELASQLISMGTEGANMAKVIASGSDEMRDHIIRAFSAGQGAADKLAGKLTNSIAGTLKDIRTTLNAIAKKWGIDVEVNADSAFSTVEALHEKLTEVSYKQWVANVRVTTSGGSTGFHLLQELNKALRAVTEQDWHVNVRVQIGDKALKPSKVTAGMRKMLEKLSSAFDEFAQGVVSEFGEDLPKAYAKSLKELSKTVRDKIQMFQKLADKAQETYDKIASAAKDFHDGIVDGFGDFKDIIGAAMDAISEASDKGGPLDLTKTLQDQVAAAQKFADELLKLQDLGLDKDLLAQIAAQGPSAEPLIAQLLGDPALVQQFNDAFGAINDIASQTAQSLTDANFGGLLEQASDALEKFNTRVDKFSDRIGDQVQKFIQGLQAKRLGDHVSALVSAIRHALQQLGVNVPQMAEGGVVTRPTLVMAGEKGPEAIVPLDRLSASGPSEKNMEEAFLRALKRNPVYVVPVQTERDLKRRVIGSVASRSLGRSSL